MTQMPSRDRPRKATLPTRMVGEARRRRRHLHLRRRLSGTGNVPRLNVYRSSANIYAQLVDDAAGRTLVAASSLDKNLETTGASKTSRAEAVGRLVAERARQAGVERVVFDRGGYLYHGRVKALADAARAAGLRF